MMLRYVIVALCFLLKNSRGEFREKFYSRILSMDGFFSKNSTTLPFHMASKFDCFLSCNSDIYCKGVFYDGRICSIVKYGTDPSSDLFPAPHTKFYRKSGKYIFIYMY